MCERLERGLYITKMEDGSDSIKTPLILKSMYDLRSTEAEIPNGFVFSYIISIFHHISPRSKVVAAGDMKTNG